MSRESIQSAAGQIEKRRKRRGGHDLGGKPELTSKTNFRRNSPGMGGGKETRKNALGKGAAAITKQKHKRTIANSENGGGGDLKGQSVRRYCGQCDPLPKVY